MNYYAVLRDGDDQVRRVHPFTGALDQKPFLHLRLKKRVLIADRAAEWPQPVTVYGSGRSGPLVIEASDSLLWPASDIYI